MAQNELLMQENKRLRAMMPQAPPTPPAGAAARHSGVCAGPGRRAGPQGGRGGRCRRGVPRVLLLGILGLLLGLGGGVAAWLRGPRMSRLREE